MSESKCWCVFYLSVSCLDWGGCRRTAEKSLVKQNWGLLPAGWTKTPEATPASSCLPVSPNPPLVLLEENRGIPNMTNCLLNQRIGCEHNTRFTYQTSGIAVMSVLSEEKRGHITGFTCAGLVFLSFAFGHFRSLKGWGWGPGGRKRSNSLRSIINCPCTTAQSNVRIHHRQMFFICYMSFMMLVLKININSKYELLYQY